MKMPSCAVASCANRNQITKGTDIKYFRFPKNEDLAKQWIRACYRGDKINLKNACICSIHFEKESFEISMKHRLLKYNPKNSRNLKADAVPVLHLPDALSKIKTERSHGFCERMQQKIVTEILHKSPEHFQASNE